MASTVVRSESRGDVALVTIDSPPVNSLSQPVVRGLLDAVAAANANPQVKAIVITGAGGNFIAGADIGELQQAAAKGAQAEAGGDPGSNLQSALEQLEANAKPIVMAIDGFALGGGLEVAMSGHWRVGTHRCRVGLPELTLGLLPGAGGTQRLPRLVGLPKAVEMMLTSSQIPAKEALELGILQEVVAPEQLVDAALAAANKLAAGQAKPIRASQQSSKLPAAAEAKQVVEMAKAMAGDKLRNLVHPDLCLDAILCGVVEGYDKGIVRERENFAKCLASPQAQGLIHMFFAPRAAAKVPGVTDQDFTVRDFQRAAVLGGGTMGSGIATALLQAGLEVTLKEVSPEAAEAGRQRIESNLMSRVKKGKLSQDKFDQMMSRLKLTTDYSGFDKMDIVIEAVIENIELKQQVFADLEQATSPSCVLASNTSTIDLEVIGARTKAGARIIGTHFFSPAHVMPLVEVVRSKQTSPQTLHSVINLVKRIKKTPVTVGNCIGFLVNRIFFPYGQSAGWLVDRGVDPYRIDRAVYNFGMPMGPFRMSDLAGGDVAKFAGGILAKAYPDRFYPSTLLDHLFAEKRFGQKTGRGYYQYDGKEEKVDADLARLVEKARADAGNPQALEMTDQEIAERIMLPVVNEACRCLEEEIAIRPSDVDVACVMGMGFPAYRGGLMKYADMLGAKYVYDKLKAWSKDHPLFTPSEYLRRKAAKNESLVG